MCINSAQDEEDEDIYLEYKAKQADEVLNPELPKISSQVPCCWFCHANIVMLFNVNDPNVNVR